MKLKISLQELASVANNKSLTYEQATFYSTLHNLLTTCLKADGDINCAKKIIDLLVAHGLEQEISSSYHTLKAQTPAEVQEELEEHKTVCNLIVYAWFKYCQAKKQSIHLLDFEESNISTPTDAQEENEQQRAVWVSPEFDSQNIIEVWRNLVYESVTLSVSQWAEKNRILGATSSKANSLFSYDIVPFWRKLADYLSINSSVQEIAIMKGVQLGATTGVLENFVGYAIDHVSSASTLMISSTKELAQDRLNEYIKPMIISSNLAHKVVSDDFFSKNKKSGATNKKVELVGGGKLRVVGANSASDLSSHPARFVLFDEVDRYPATVGKDGDPLDVGRQRANTFGNNKKLLYISTPLITETSNIYPAYLAGNRLKYLVPCLKCGKYQELEFNKVNKETGEIYGLTFKTLENGNLDYDSVRYLCKFCQHPHKNHDKTAMFARGDLVATAESQKANYVSAHISGLYSPVGFKSWEEICYDWLQAWDIVTNKPKDIYKLQAFYNLALGLPFREAREKLEIGVISKHKRNYQRYILPNEYAQKHTGQKIRIITAAVDVHKDNLAVVITGWANGRCFLLDYERIKGNCEKPEDDSWQKLWELMQKEYTDVEGVDKFTVAQIFIDTGYKQYTVAQAAANSPDGVRKKIQLIKGESSNKVQQINHKYGTKSLSGYRQLIVYIDNYKDYIYSKLQYAWEQGEEMPDGHFNAYNSITRAQLKELTNESKQELKDPLTGKVVGYKWERTGNNELFDGLVYNYCAIEFIAELYYNAYKAKYSDLEVFSMTYFWEKLFPIIEQQELYG